MVLMETLRDHRLNILERAYVAWLNGVGQNTAEGRVSEWGIKATAVDLNAGQRQIREARQHLEEFDYITIRSRYGKPPEITLLRSKCPQRAHRSSLEDELDVSLEDELSARNRSSLEDGSALSGALSSSSGGGSVPRGHDSSSSKAHSVRPLRTPNQRGEDLSPSLSKGEGETRVGETGEKPLQIIQSALNDAGISGAASWPSLWFGLLRSQGRINEFLADVTPGNAERGAKALASEIVKRKKRKTRMQPDWALEHFESGMVTVSDESAPAEPEPEPEGMDEFTDENWDPDEILTPLQ